MYRSLTTFTTYLRCLRQPNFDFTSHSSLLTIQLQLYQQHYQQHRFHRRKLSKCLLNTSVPSLQVQAYQLRRQKSIVKSNWRSNLSRVERQTVLVWLLMKLFLRLVQTFTLSLSSYTELISIRSLSRLSGPANSLYDKADL